MCPSRCLACARSLAVCTPGPATWPSLTLFKFFFRPANSALSGRLLLGIFDPANKLVSRQWRDVLPRIKRRGVGNQRCTKIRWQFVHDAAGQPRITHSTTVVVGDAHGANLEPTSPTVPAYSGAIASFELPVPAFC
jgi:hypothetical protein